MAYRGMGDTVIGPGGFPVDVDPGSSVTLDFSQGYAVAPGAPGSTSDGGGIVPTTAGATPFTPAQAPSFLSKYSNVILIGSMALLALMVVGPGGRR